MTDIAKVNCLWCKVGILPALRVIISNYIRTTNVISFWLSQNFFCYTLAKNYNRRNKILSMLWEIFSSFKNKRVDFHVGKIVISKGDTFAMLEVSVPTRDLLIFCCKFLAWPTKIFFTGHGKLQPHDQIKNLMTFFLA